MPAGKWSLTIMYQCMKHIVNEQEPLYSKNHHFIQFHSTWTKYRLCFFQVWFFTTYYKNFIGLDWTPVVVSRIDFILTYVQMKLSLKNGLWLKIVFPYFRGSLNILIASVDKKINGKNIMFTSTLSKWQPAKVRQPVILTGCYGNWWLLPILGIT